MNETVKSPKRIVLDINEMDHRNLKIRAAERNISISAWLRQAIIEKIAQEDLWKENNEKNISTKNN